jgi:hypothetical protein
LLADGAARPSEDVVDAVEKAAKHAAQYYVEMSKETVRNQNELHLAFNKNIDAKTRQTLQDFAQDFYTPLNVNALLNEIVC